MPSNIYLCDSDVISDVSFNCVSGLVLMLYDSNAIIQYLQGMANTYRVSSYFQSSAMCIIHEKISKSLSLLRNFLIFFQFAIHLYLLGRVWIWNGRFNMHWKGEKPAWTYKLIIWIEHLAYVLSCCPAGVSKPQNMVKNDYLNDDERLL